VANGLIVKDWWGIFELYTSGITGPSGSPARSVTDKLIDKFGAPPFPPYARLNQLTITDGFLSMDEAYNETY
jgi:hypothetical protein